MARKIAFCGVFSALAVILGYLERFIPLPVPVPGVKLGLANAAVLIIMYCVGEKQAGGVSAIRILLTGFLVGGPTSLIYSAAGGVLSFAAMACAKRTRIFSVVGVSVAGGVGHNLGQIMIAALVVNNYRLLYYVPVLTISGVAAGGVTGVIASYTIRHLGDTGSRIFNQPRRS